MHVLHLVLLLMLESSAIGEKIKIGLILAEPFASIHPDCQGAPDSEKCRGNSRYRGFCVDLLQFISAAAKDFDYELKNDTRVGRRHTSGDWDGALGQLFRNDTDLVIGPISITASRAASFEFTQPFLNTGISVMIKKPQRVEPGPFCFLQAFSVTTWGYIIFTYAGMIFLHVFLLYKRIKRNYGEPMRAYSEKILRTICYVFTLFVFGLYTANLSTIIQHNLNEKAAKYVDGGPVPESLDELLDGKLGIQLAVVKDGSTFQFLQYSPSTLYSRIWKKMMDQGPESFVSSYPEGISRVRKSQGKFAFLLEETANAYVNGRRPCDTMKIGGLLNGVGYGIIGHKGSKLIPLINEALLNLKEKGELLRLEDKWWRQQSECNVETDRSPGLKFRAIVGLFYFIAVMLALNLVFAVFENVICRTKKTLESTGLTS